MRRCSKTRENSRPPPSLGVPRLQQRLTALAESWAFQAAPPSAGERVPAPGEFVLLSETGVSPPAPSDGGRSGAPSYCIKFKTSGLRRLFGDAVAIGPEKPPCLRPCLNHSPMRITPGTRRSRPWPCAIKAAEPGVPSCNFWNYAEPRRDYRTSSALTPAMRRLSSKSRTDGPPVAP